MPRRKRWATRLNLWVSIFAQPIHVQLAEQIELLDGANRLYDEGSTINGKSIAVRVGTIVEILRCAEGGAFCRDKNLRFPTPIPLSLDGPIEVSPLVDKTLVLSEHGETIGLQNLPVFLRTQPPIIYHARLSKWLDQGCFLSSWDQWITRQSALTSIRNKDGGGHSPSRPDRDSLQFWNDEGKLSIEFHSGHKPVPSIAMAVMRQISWEILAALRPAV